MKVYDAEVGGVIPLVKPSNERIEGDIDSHEFETFTEMVESRLAHIEAKYMHLFGKYMFLKSRNEELEKKAKPTFYESGEAIEVGTEKTESKLRNKNEKQTKKQKRKANSSVQATKEGI